MYRRVDTWTAAGKTVTATVERTRHGPVFARATGRHFAKYLSSMILFIGYIMAGFTERKQALHDIIASTVVVRR